MKMADNDDLENGRNQKQAIKAELFNFLNKQYQKAKGNAKSKKRI